MSFLYFFLFLIARKSFLKTVFFYIRVCP